MGKPIDVTVKPTLDPAVRRFETNRWLTGMGGRLYFSEDCRPPTAPAPKEGSLEHKLLRIEGVVSVYAYGSTITISKDEEHSWEQLEPEIVETIKNAYTFYAKAS